MDLLQQPGPRLCISLEMAFDHGFTDSSLAQLRPDAYGTAAFMNPAGDEILGVTIVALQTRCGQFTNNAVYDTLIETAGAQL